MFLSVFDDLTLLAAGLFKKKKPCLVVVAHFLFDKLKAFFDIPSPGRNEIT